MKNFLLTSILCLGFINATSQCTPDPIYQDSTYNIWPDTVINLPIVSQGLSYQSVLNIKTPTTLIEAASGDSSFTQLDTTIFGTSFDGRNISIKSTLLSGSISEIFPKTFSPHNFFPS